MSCVTLVKAALARFLFSLHAFITIQRVVKQEGDSYYYLAICNLFQLGEGLHCLCYRRGEELKWFSPSVFIYLASIVPAIWILELDTNRKEILCIYVDIVKTTPESSRQAMLMDLMQVFYGSLRRCNMLGCKKVDRIVWSNRTFVNRPK